MAICITIIMVLAYTYKVIFNIYFKILELKVLYKVLLLIINVRVLIMLIYFYLM